MHGSLKPARCCPIVQMPWLTCCGCLLAPPNHHLALHPATGRLRAGTEIRLVFVTPEKVMAACVCAPLRHWTSRSHPCVGCPLAPHKATSQARCARRDPPPNTSHKHRTCAHLQVARSDVLIRTLDSLAADGRLARVVIDEAHCVSVRGWRARLPAARARPAQAHCVWVHYSVL